MNQLKDGLFEFENFNDAIFILGTTSSRDSRR